MSHYRSIFWSDPKPSGDWKYPSVSFYRPNTPPLPAVSLPPASKESETTTEQQIKEFTEHLDNIFPNPKIKEYVMSNLVTILENEHNESSE